MITIMKTILVLRKMIADVRKDEYFTDLSALALEAANNVVVVLSILFKENFHG